MITHVLCTKYLLAGVRMVDCVSVTMSMVRKANATNVRKLAEFVISRSALGRGGEHAFCRWNETTYDPYFRCADMTWHQLKTTSEQCMLLPVDRTHYCLDVYWALGAYFMYGGLERNEFNPIVKDYMFPYLHNMKKDNVSRKMTNNIRRHIDVSGMSKEEAKTHKNRFSSRSTRIAAMTENRLQPDLTVLEEFTRSGHKSRGINSEAEGYIASTPANNFPGGLALAGYKNLHMVPMPPTLDALHSAREATARLVKAMYCVDVEQFKEGGALYILLEMCTARLVASFNQLLRETGKDNEIVMRIQRACILAKIDDPAVKRVGQHRAFEVLQDWSARITNHFEEENAKLLVTHDGKVSTALESMTGAIKQFGVRLANVEASVAESVGTRRLLEREKELMAEVKGLKAHLELMTESKNRHKGNCKVAYQKLLAASPDLMPTPTTPQNDFTGAEVLVPGMPSAARHLDLSSQPTNVALKAPTVHDFPARQTTAGQTVQTELTRLAEAKVFFPGHGLNLAKAMLFDSKDPHYIGVPTQFPERSRYRDAMIVVAMTIKKTVQVVNLRNSRRCGASQAGARDCMHCQGRDGGARKGVWIARGREERQRWNWDCWFWGALYEAVQGYGDESRKR